MMKKSRRAVFKMKKYRRCSISFKCNRQRRCEDKCVRPISSIFFFRYASVDEEDDFQEVLDPPSVAPATQYQLSLAFPDPSKHKVGDLFEELGPVAVFNARHFWSAPREVRMRKADRQGFGFSVRGDAPVVVAGVDAGSLAEVSDEAASLSQ